MPVVSSDGMENAFFGWPAIGKFPRDLPQLSNPNICHFQIFSAHVKCGKT
jgi:hypothetical protein